MTGPATRKQVDDVAAMIGEKIVPLGAVEAALAAQLYNRAGRKAALRLDSMIAATAICSAARLATANRKDFSLFTPSGLRLI
jgi:predicted nucleic acid-binding protein